MYTHFPFPRPHLQIPTRMDQRECYHVICIIFFQVPPAVINGFKLKFVTVTANGIWQILV